MDYHLTINESAINLPSYPGLVSLNSKMNWQPSFLQGSTVIAEVEFFWSSQPQKVLETVHACTLPLFLIHQWDYLNRKIEALSIKLIF